MADLAWTLFLLLAIYRAAGVQAASSFAIVEPYPYNIYPLEFTSAEVTCAAYDASGVKIPSKILFMRRDQFNQYIELKENDNLYFTNRTETHDNKTKLYVTLHIRNVTLKDDSLYGDLGSYECHAYAVGDVVERARHGFSVSVITRSEFPEVVIFPVDTVHVLQYNENITLTCNLTRRGNRVPSLKRISWLKNGVRLESVRNPNPEVPRDTLGPLFIKNLGVKSGGNYTCLLEVVYRYVRQFNASDETVIQAKAKDKEVHVNSTMAWTSHGTLVVLAFFVVAFLCL
ncbi:hypothetical protein ACROYT_G023412 [Oculina patagonica]